MSIAKKTPRKHCSANDLRLLGDYWTLAIIQLLDNQPKRFTELQREIPRVSPTTLANRLKKLKSQQIVSRKKESINKLSVVYSLTEKGKGILPILREIDIFAKQFLK